MGANIDYAIVISGRFMELKDKMPKKDAIIETMNFAFPTIVTSGSMLALAGIFIGQMSSDGAICGIGQCLGARYHLFHYRRYVCIAADFAAW